MTIDEIKTCDREFLTPAQVAPLLCCDPQDIRVCAKQCPERLGFPVIVIKSRTKIPRIPFLRYIGADD